MLIHDCCLVGHLAEESLFSFLKSEKAVWGADSPWAFLAGRHKDYKVPGGHKEYKD